VKAADVALEVSSAGLRKPIAEIYPHPRIIDQAAELQIPFAYGSDAHAPGEVGHGMVDCIVALQASGIHEVASFHQRQRQMIPLLHE